MCSVSEPVSPLHVGATPRSSVSVTSSVQSVVVERPAPAAVFQFPSTVVSSGSPLPQPASSPPRKQLSKLLPHDVVVTSGELSHGDQANTTVEASSQPACSGAGCASASASVTVTQATVDHSAHHGHPVLHQPPVGVTVTSQTATSFTLMWLPSSPNTLVTGYTFSLQLCTLSL